MPFDAVRCLACDPFDGDYGSPGDKLLCDEIRIARKPREHCHMCDGPIAKGERHRARVEVVDGAMMAFRWCELCCEAMALWPDDDGDAIEARTMMHPNMAQYRTASEYRSKQDRSPEDV